MYGCTTEASHFISVIILCISGLIIQIIQFIRVIEHIIKLIIAIIILFRHDCKKLRTKLIEIRQ